MAPLLSMWSNTRMVVLMALSAALYAAILIPFKFATIIPGLTEIRPAACIPIVTGILFGPAACWGSALGNVIGDVAGGQFGPGSVVGAVGNFLYAFIAWKLWEAFRFDAEEEIGKKIGAWIVLCLSASAGCALVLGWGVDVMGLVPFAFLAVVVFLNNLVVSLLLGPPLLRVLLPRATRWGLRWRAILEVPGERVPRIAPALMLVAATIGGVSLLLLYSVGVMHVPLLDPSGARQAAAIAYGGLPFLAFIVIAMFLL